jgi:hypothetical protein
MLYYTFVPEADQYTTLSPTNPFFNIFLDLPTEYTQFYCSKKYYELNSDIIKLLESKNKQIIIDNFSKICENNLIYSNIVNRVNPNTIFTLCRANNCRFLYYQVESEDISWRPEKNEFVFYLSERQVFYTMPMAIYSLDAKGAPEVGVMPDGGQGVAVGVVRDPKDYLSNTSNKDKKILRKEIENELSVKIPKDKPLLVYFLHHNHDIESIGRGINSLSNKGCTIIIKDMLNYPGHEHLQSNYKDYIYGPNIIYCSKQSSNFNNCLRFAADVSLLPCFSGTICSSIMIECRIIPIYTDIIYQSASHISKNIYSDFITQVKMPFRDIPCRILSYLPPINIEATDMLLKKINNDIYWQSYDNQIKNIKFNVFGKVYTDEVAINRVKYFIAKLISFNSLISPDFDKNKFKKSIKLSNIPVTI